MTFSYFLLCDFSYYYEDDYYTELLNDTDFLNSTFGQTANLSDIASIKKEFIKPPSYLEYILIYWVFALVVEEVRQFFDVEEGKFDLRRQLIEYLRDKWNKIDLVCCILFVVGESLKMASFFEKKRVLLENIQVKHSLLCL
jgi:hypothetical protein